ncbi:hypothetical protein [Methanoplanus endosymbiosus]|uniref:Uncharacterized protein n=1 Tax=Methanoplanus endosymbiosus TaxID=33865 RepID=A0A9E7PQY7_9EURY|nr:hypothetical protein [Methanoplanus endosymbiosus]UUX93722.1 hypothetical protein L6E24_06305 [Methanoplanus endosymbiosus]
MHSRNTLRVSPEVIEGLDPIDRRICEVLIRLGEIEVVGIEEEHSNFERGCAH